MTILVLRLRIQRPQPAVNVDCCAADELVGAAEQVYNGGGDIFDPGTAWNYSMSTDVCGAVIEAITGSTLAQAFAERVFEPLGMVDTGFTVPAGSLDRFTSLYAPIGDDPLTRIDRWETSSYTEPPAFLSGGGGLVSTADDYQTFASMRVNGSSPIGA